MATRPRPVLLLIRDGWGYREETGNNAIAAASTPVHDRLYEEFPWTLIKASGNSVGLPEGIMGNSEVGHLNLGAGRRVLQEVVRIDEAIEDGSFFEVKELQRACDHAKKNDSALHLMGLCSDGLVHSSLEHLWALLKMAKKRNVPRVYVHCFMDGRDTPPHSGKGYIEQVEKKVREIGIGKIATVIGRYYAMDRDNRWDRLEKAYKALVKGEGARRDSAVEAMEKSYSDDVTDEFVKPAVIHDDIGKPVGTVNAEDAIIMFNFRSDRMRQVATAFFQADFDKFERPEGVYPFIVSMTQYRADFPLEVAFKPKEPVNTMKDVLASNGLKQLRIAETEKFAHVTFFFSGGVDDKVEGEDRALIPSPQVATYDLQPEMSAFEVRDEAVKRIDSGKYDFIVLNFANPDMVGHTGEFHAAVAAVETVDTCVGDVLNSVSRAGGVALITADHGNCEIMRHPDGEEHTQHTTSPVHLVLFDKSRKDATLKSGALCDVSPTLLELMGLSQPAEMTGSSLLG